MRFYFKSNLFSAGILAFLFVIPLNIQAQESAQSLAAGASELIGIQSYDEATSQLSLKSQMIRAARKPANKKPKRPKKPKKPTNNPSGQGQVVFSGVWSNALTKTADTCPGSTTPARLNVTIKIDANLNGTDAFDGSPLFQGRVDGKNIAFGRARNYQGCSQKQAFYLLNVNGNNASSYLRSDVICPQASCYTEYKGPAIRK